MDARRLMDLVDQVVYCGECHHDYACAAHYAEFEKAFAPQPSSLVDDSPGAALRPPLPDPPPNIVFRGGQIIRRDDPITGAPPRGPDEPPPPAVARGSYFA